MPIIPTKVCFVSGGVDSMFLLHQLGRQSDPILAAHINYHLRGQDSELDEALVREVCEDHNWPLLVFQKPITVKTGIQEQARAIKWRVMRDLAAQTYQHFYLGHHAGDQLEAILMHLLRGAGPRGLKGMSATQIMDNGLILHRPLLSLTKTEIRSQAQATAIPFREDASNQTDTYFRNQLRHHLIPSLNADEVLYSKMEESRRALENYLLKQASQVQVLLNDSQKICRQRYLQSGPSLRFALIEALQSRAGLVHALSRLHFRAIDAAIANGATTQIGVLLLDKSWIQIEWEKFVPESLLIPQPGDYVLPESGLRICLRALPAMDPKNCDSPAKLYLQTDSFTWPLTLRFPQLGDRFQAYGMTGTKKLSDFFIDRKIPHHQRARTPLLVQDDLILAVLGHEINHHCRLIKAGPAVEVFCCPTP